MPRGDSLQTVKATLGLRQLLFDWAIRPGERLVELSLVRSPRFGTRRWQERRASGNVPRSSKVGAAVTS